MRLVSSKHQHYGVRCSVSAVHTHNVSPQDPCCADIHPGYTIHRCLHFPSLKLPESWKTCRGRQMALYLVPLLLCSSLPICPEGEQTWIQICSSHMCLSQWSCWGNGGAVCCGLKKLCLWHLRICSKHLVSWQGLDACKSSW